MKICLVYHMRLGDVIRVLPIARWLSSQGHEVYIECLEQYSSFFSCVSYARPALPEHRAAMNYGRVIDLQIWPNRYDDFRRSGKPWDEYVFGLFPEFSLIGRTPKFDLIDETRRLEDYGLTRDVCIFSPFGYSQVRRHRFSDLLRECRRLATKPIVILADKKQVSALRDAGVKETEILCARSLGDLPRLLRDAAEVFTINSAPAIIAGAVRKEFWHVLSGCAQDDTFSPASRVVTIDA